ncbi:flagellar basal-body rod modification protein FlgD [Lachnospiraceae bacterium]|nr:flagellar basal-body rod modification protein FlgD [Lachnospiraceae bacterium]
MATSAIVRDGKIVNLTNETENTKNNNSSVSKEQFLQLLVAQMKYQDPLEPMDNTEYVSQLATFSELEQMQNISATSEMQRATGLVGNMVTINYTNPTTGAQSEVSGKVDYVTMSGSRVKVAVNDELYDLDDVVQVWDAEYANAVKNAQIFISEYQKLPGVLNITASNAANYYKTIDDLNKVYNAMSLYQQSFISKEVSDGLKAYIEQMKKYGYTFDT